MLAATVTSPQSVTAPPTTWIARLTMATDDDPEHGGLVATFSELRERLDRVDLPAELRASVEQFDQALRSDTRARTMRLARYRLLFDAAPDPYIVTDRDGIVTEANSAAGELLGSDPSTIVNRPLVDYVTPAERDRYLGWLAQLQAGAPEARWDTTIETGGAAGPTPVEIGLADDLEGIGYRWLVRDQRERSAAERHLIDVAEREHQAADGLRAEAKLNTQFMRSLSHDLRGPIGALIHQAELLTSQNLSPEIRDRSSAALENNARKLRQILEALVDIERYAARDIDLRLTITPIGDVLAALRRSDEEDGISIGDFDPTIMVAVDRDVMRRALLTLVNAIKDADDERITIEIGTDARIVQIDIRAQTARSLSEDQIEVHLARTLLAMHGGSMHQLQKGTIHSIIVSLPTGDQQEP